MALTSLEIDGLVIVIFLAVVVAGLLLYLLRRLRGRRDKLLKELSGTPELAQDRAFNRIAMARREAEILSRAGTDVTNAQSLIAEAQGAFDTRQYDRAYERAQSAHEALVVARRSGPGPGAPLPSPTAPPPRSSVSPPPTSPPTPSSDPAAPRIPQNRAESQFQLRLLDQEYTDAAAAHPGAPATVAVGSILSQAHGAFDRGDFTEAFRLSLRGRRQLGGKVESLAPSGTNLAGYAATVSVAMEANPGDVAVQAADRAAGADRCPDCGYPTLPSDRFCRGCGQPRGATNCPVCQASRGPADTFCGVCGARFS